MLLLAVNSALIHDLAISLTWLRHRIHILDTAHNILNFAVDPNVLRIADVSDFFLKVTPVLTLMISEIK
jgi:hypothetical protein